MVEQGRLDFGSPDARAPRERLPGSRGRQALSVSQLTDALQGVLETEFFDVWVEGEIGTLTAAASGHWYLTLKDDKATLRTVVWKSTARRMRFRPREGMKVVARGGIRVYPPKGEYQLVVELLEPAGLGSLQQAFEDLKERLTREGLFDPARKRTLPMLPRRIAVVTSPTGAVIRDILHVLARRFANLDVLIYPARVQGAGAAAEIVAGIEALGALPGIDVVIVARGGGSLEDLWAFNEEPVARALASCPVPTISAVGHETDFTIADFVADVRAPTPSAAAEIVVEAKADLAERVARLDHRARSAMAHMLTRVRSRLDALAHHRAFAAERGRLHVHAQRVDDLAGRGLRALMAAGERARTRERHLAARLDVFRPDRQIASAYATLAQLGQRLELASRRLCARRRERASDLVRRLVAWPGQRQVAAARERVAARRDRLHRAARARVDALVAETRSLDAKLRALSPLGVLDRGYALVWGEKGERLVRGPDDTRVGATLHIRLHGGHLQATVTSKEPL